MQRLFWLQLCLSSLCFSLSMSLSASLSISASLLPLSPSSLPLCPPPSPCQLRKMLTCTLPPLRKSWSSPLVRSWPCLTRSCARCPRGCARCRRTRSETRWRRPQWSRCVPLAASQSTGTISQHGRPSGELEELEALGGVARPGDEGQHQGTHTAPPLPFFTYPPLLLCVPFMLRGDL
jgi:hypothetical protein